MRFVFFSFHYERDVWRANVVRNSWVTKGKSVDRNADGFIDAVSFEAVKKRGDKAVEDWIDSELKGTSVTVVLIGKETSERKFVKYEIEKSIERGNGLIGIRINQIENQNGETDAFGNNPFREFNELLEKKNYVTPIIYLWYVDNGYLNINDWIEKAARERGK